MKLFGIFLLALVLKVSADDVLSAAEGVKTVTPSAAQQLLRAKCYGCHGEDKKNLEGEFDVSTRDTILKGGESGKPAIVPGHPDSSPLFRAVQRVDKTKMPPKDRNALSPEEVEILKQWILAGSPWTSEASTTASQPEWNYKAEDIWAFQKIKRVSIPEVEGTKSINPIDAFIREKLTAKQLEPAPRSDRLTLIRRATFDLTGLPPTVDEIRDFMSDNSSEAFNKVIERLLASPRYGEKMARQWLDVVRYADTDGYSNDYERPNAWRYRDYVIRSFNQNKPYDQFIVEQIAGDELVTKGPDALIAIGMLRMGPWEHTAMSVAAVTRQLFLDDATSIVGAAYLGLTTGCARCHDHKFDPISTKDYYRLQSCFAPAQFDNPKVEFLPEENAAEFSKEIARVDASIKTLRSRIKTIREKHDRAIDAWLKEKGFKSLSNVPQAERPQKDYGLTAADMGTEKVLRKRVEYLEREGQRFRPKAFSISNNASDVPDLHILIGGALESPGEVVTPGVLRAVSNSSGTLEQHDRDTIPENPHGRRLKLAQWITSTDNPLTARVMVNRIWQWHFGKGIVKSSNNFGKMGDRPTHPELLDWLANYFIEHGWDVKEMHRLIMRSETYQQRSQPVDIEELKLKDAEDKYLAHFIPRRMTAEELRDSILLIAGDLNSEMGGPPVYPEINLEAALQPRHVMGSMAPPYAPSQRREQRNRRTIYTVQIRSLINPMLQVFNAASTEISCERRDETTVTPQVFSLFNSQNVHDSALSTAANISAREKNRLKQITELYRSAYGRDPSQRELTICSDHLAKSERYHEKNKPDDFRFPSTVTRTMVEELTGEPFQFEEAWDLNTYQYNLQPSQVLPATRALADLCLVIFNSNEFVYIY